ncbi:hypothetical protein [Negadavirga shengliensis]|uniref:Uncharacterized protein n=1 Tax=Negadavirga shengliensis TaxID=1389218 RepID=A0ABV9T452_9BACT
MQDYWHKFDLLCSELKKNGQHDVEYELRKAQGYVNGLTDGWYDFLNEFNRITKSNILTDTPKELADKLIEILKYRLENK